MLSEMLNFVLYECTPVTYSLNKELDFLRNLDKPPKTNITTAYREYAFD
ncbi:MAG: hypothetical protein U9N53_06305 [Bacteroidota bacterium]|nr:hypothetical protein [Bacteroidota bacterium]